MDNPIPTTDAAARTADGRLLPLWVRGGLIPLGLIAAGAALVHAGSENGITPLALPSALDSSLNAETRARLVDMKFKAELADDIQAGREASVIPQELHEEAKNAYRAKPLDAGLLRTIATGKVAFEDQARAFTIVQQLVEVNRRDPIANMWLVQAYGSRGDIAPMLAIFDQTLRTNRDIRTTAMPAFVNLLTFEEGRKAIRDLLADEPVWEPEFWAEFAKNATALTNAELFFGPDGYNMAALEDEYRESIFRGLKAAGLYDALFRLAENEGSDAVLSEDADDGFASARRSDPFGWEVTSTGKYVTMVEREGSVLQIDAEAGSFGVVAQRLIRAPSSGQLALRLVEPLEEDARLEARLICADESRSVVAQAVIGEGETEASGPIANSSCSFATLALIVNVEGGRGSVNLRVESARVIPSQSSVLR